MKTITWIIAAHLVAIAVLIGFGFAMNDTLKENKYQGVITVLSAAFGVYCFAVNILYHNNHNVYLLVNRMLLVVRRTHTYWLPTFDFTLSDVSLGSRREVIDLLEKSLQSLPHKSFKRSNVTPFNSSIAIDDTFYLVFRVDEAHLHVSLDRKILVPSHLYDTYRQRLARIAELISNTVKPDSVRLGISITFGDGVSNPYFGFFVQRVPSQLLRHFEASFLLAQSSSCRIEAGTDSINIESQGAIDFFEALSQVLAMNATPPAGATQ